MLILADEKLIDEKGEIVFQIETYGGKSRLAAIRADTFIAGDTVEEARACLYSLACRLCAHKWSSDAQCFVPVFYENKTVGRVIEYMSQDTYPAHRVDDVLYIVSLMSLCEESDRDVKDFLEKARAKDYFDEGGAGWSS